LFGERLASTTPATITPTTAGSTQMNYTDLAKSSGRRPAHAAPMQPVAPPATPRQLNADYEPGQLDLSELRKAVTEHYGPNEE